MINYKKYTAISAPKNCQKYIDRNIIFQNHNQQKRVNRVLQE